MKLGLYLRNMGPQSTRPLIADAARAAEEAGIDDLWVADHLALPPEESEGSDGRYVEALATLAFLAGITERVSLAVGVLIVPYRPALLTAKWIASIQELSAGRLILGVGVGWMEKEFRALGADPQEPWRDHRRDACLPARVLRRRRGRGERPDVPVPPAPAAPADHRRRRTAACHPACGPLRRRLDADGRARQGAGSRHREPARGHGGGRQAGAGGRAAAAAAGRGRREACGPTPRARRARASPGSSIPGATGTPRRSPASPRAWSPPGTRTRRPPEGHDLRTRLPGMNFPGASPPGRAVRSKRATAAHPIRLRQAPALPT